MGLSPRAERFRLLSSALVDVSDVELLSAGSDHRPPDRRPALPRRLVNRLRQAAMLDRDELHAIGQLRGWPAAVDAALLIGFPFSPLGWTARRLARAGVPYVVDIGDPWVLTAFDPPPPSLATFRARRFERSMWAHAAGAIVTTDIQATALRRHFPRLPTLVRPNGFLSVRPPPDRPGCRRRAARELSVVYYGSMYGRRLDLAGFLNKLAGSQRWEAIRFTMYGADLNGTLARLGPGVHAEIREPRPWEESVAAAAAHDVAIAVGSQEPGPLPSKAVQYLTLPIPRVALVNGDPSDAFERYVADKPGWLRISVGDDPVRSAMLLAEHVQRPWRAADLAPPATESWSAVTAQVLAFLSSSTGVMLPATGV